jgi:hypothetical protein
MNTHKSLVYAPAGLGHLGFNSKGQTLHDEYYFLPRMRPISNYGGNFTENTDLPESATLA